MTYKKRTLEEIISELGEIPHCQCEGNCGQRIKISPKRYSYYKKHGYPKFVSGHGTFGKKRPEHSEAMKGKGNPMFGNPREDLQIKFKGEGNPMFNKEAWNLGLTKETDLRIKKISDGLKNVPKTQDHKDKISKIRIDNEIAKGERNPFYGKHHTLETIDIIRLKNIGKIDSQETKLKKKKVVLELWKNPDYIKKHSGINASGYGRTPPIKCSYGIQSYYDSPFQGNVRLRSSYELKYAKYLDSINEPWYYEYKTFHLSDEMTYTPDFYLPLQNKYIEIKGYMKPRDRLKIDKFKKEYLIKLDILFGKDLENLGINLRGV